MKTYILLEIANSHGGSPKQVARLIDTIPHQKNTGIKFQIFKYDRIALPDFPAYRAYQKLFFNPKTWGTIFKAAQRRGFFIWLDLFDSYSLEILEKNASLITGVKLQSSVLENDTLIRQLAVLSKKHHWKILINIAGRTLNNIRSMVEKLSILEHRGNFILQAGFQSYPTRPKDFLLHKINILKQAFPNCQIGYADHGDATNELAFSVPVFAVLAGANFIEKHVCLNRMTSPYDRESSLEPSEIPEFFSRIADAEIMLGHSFVSANEQAYLQNTAEKPLTGTELPAGSLINFAALDYRRTSQNGLTIDRLHRYAQAHFCLKNKKQRGKTFQRDDLRKTRIGIMIACRMKSTRLKHKAILPIGEYNSIERCIINAKKIKSADEIVLATSTLPEDQILKKYALKHKIRFFAGHPDDVITRFLIAAQKYKIDVIIRITGDCPTIAPEVAEYLLEKHFAAGADYTAARKFTIGFNSEIYSVDALKRIIKYMGNAPHSEYMTWYMQNNPDIFNINLVDLPDEWIRKYRLTLDEQADLDMFRMLFAKLQNRPPTMKNIYQILDAMPDIPKINAHIALKFKTNQKLINLLNKETRISLAKTKK